MWKYLIRVCNCLHYQVRHFYDISRQEITLPRFYGVHVANNDVLHPPRPNMKGKQLRSMYIYTSPGFFYWKCRILEISFYIKFFYFLFIFINFMCKYSFSMGILFLYYIFLLSFYIYQFLCASICLVAVEKHVYIYLAWFLLLKMPYTGNFFLYYIFYFLFIFIIFMCKYSFSMGICFYIIFFYFLFIFINFDV